MRTLKAPIASSLMLTSDPDITILLFGRFQTKCPIISLVQFSKNSEPNIEDVLEGVMVTTGMGEVVITLVGATVLGEVVSEKEVVSEEVVLGVVSERRAVSGGTVISEEEELSLGEVVSRGGVISEEEELSLGDVVSRGGVISEEEELSLGEVVSRGGVISEGAVASELIGLIVSE